MDKLATTHEFRENTGTWKVAPGGRFFINLRQINGHQIWIDRRLLLPQVFVTEKFRSAAAEAAIVGVGYSSVPTVEV